MTKFLKFRLAVDEDGWPPAGAESMPVEELPVGYRILVPPFFLRELSVGDVVNCSLDDEGYVDSWAHQGRSQRSTIWVFQSKLPQWNAAKSALLESGCNVETYPNIGLHAIDLPSEVTLQTFDKLLAPCIAAGAMVAYPSLRHADTS
jgi:hypothetical protein